MRWIVPLSSAIALGMTASAAADPPVRTFSGQPNRIHQGAIIPAPAPPASDSIPDRVNVATRPLTSRPVFVPDEPAVTQPPAATTTPAQIVTPQPPTQAPVQFRTPARFAPAQPQSQGPLGRLMELERRKNAWLRSVFFR